MVTGHSERAVSRQLRHLLLALFSTAVLLVGCDTTVQAFKTSEQYHYSVFGVLNPAQDTQWVRVEPVGRSTSQGTPGSIDVTVTLEHVESGQTWTLRDSVMEVARGEPQHNYWTPAPIAPGATYRLVVRNAEGDTTQATTTTPDAPPSVQVTSPILLPCVERCPSVNTLKVRMRTPGELAGMKIRYFQTFEEVVSGDFGWYDEVVQEGNAHVVQINYLEDLRTLNRTMARTCIADSAYVITAAGGPDWPEWAQYHGASVSTIARPDSFSNVRGGHGMLAGVYTDTTTVPVEQREGPVRCALF